MKQVSVMWRRLTLSLLVLAVGVTVVFTGGFRATANSRYVNSASPASLSLAPLPIAGTGRVVYTDAGDIFYAEADTKKVIRQLTVDGWDVKDIQPALSPDGKTVVFAREVGVGATKNFDLFKISVTGGIPQRINGTPQDETEPVWSPDNSKIAFVRGKDPTWGHEINVNNSSDIYVLALNGGEQRLTSDGRSSDPAWSPANYNGLPRIAFTSKTSESGVPEAYFNIYTVLASDGSSKQRITTTDPITPKDNGDPAWSPDGLKIAYASGYTRVSDQQWGNMPIGNSGPHATVNPAIIIRNLAANTETLLNTTSGVAACEPFWSPSGLQLSFTSVYFGSHEVHVINADGTGEYKLADPGCSASWSVD